MILKALAVKVSLCNASNSYRGGGHINPLKNGTILKKTINKMIFSDFFLIKRDFII